MNKRLQLVGCHVLIVLIAVDVSIFANLRQTSELLMKDEFILYIYLKENKSKSYVRLIEIIIDNNLIYFMLLGNYVSFFVCYGTLALLKTLKFSYDDLKQLLLNYHINFKLNLITEYYKFKECKQAAGESINYSICYITYEDVRIL